MVFVVHHEHADAPHPTALLRARRERPCRRAAEPSYKFAPSKAHLVLPFRGQNSTLSRSLSSGPGPTPRARPMPVGAAGWRYSTVQARGAANRLLHCGMSVASAAGLIGGSRT